MNLIIPVAILILTVVPFAIATYKDANESMDKLNEGLRKKKMNHV